jgi:hypothetical protein
MRAPSGRFRSNLDRLAARTPSAKQNKFCADYLAEIHTVFDFDQIAGPDLALN